MPLLLLPTSATAPTYTDPTAALPRELGFVLTVDGCALLFAEPGVTGVSWTGARDPDWCQASDAAQWSVHATLDVRDGLAWTETVEPLDGATRVSGLTFRLLSTAVLDALLATSETLGAASTVLTASATATALSLSVGDASIFTAPGTAWVDREAVRITAAGGGTLTVAAGGRGAYGSRAAAHNLDAADGYAPEVYAAFPGFARRRVVLWLARLEGGAAYDPVPVWRGLVTTAPRLTADGTAWELPCEHVATALADVRIGVPAGGVRVQGYQSTYEWLAGVSGYVTVGGSQLAFGETLGPGSAYRSLNDVAQTLSERLRVQLAAKGITGAVLVTTDGGGLVLRMASVTGTRAHADLFAMGPTPSVGLDWDAGATLDPSATARLAMPPALVECLYGEPTPLPLASVAELPATGWSSYDASDGPGLTVRATQCLVSALRDGWRLTATPSADDVAADNVVDRAARTFRGVVRLSGPAGATPPATIEGMFTFVANGGRAVSASGYIVGALAFGVSLAVEASSWVYGLRAALVEDTVLAGSAASIDCDPDDWAWDRVEALRAALPETLQARRWVFDGTQTLAALLGEELKLAGGLLALRRSRLAPAPILVPTRADACDAAHTVNVHEELSGRPRWAQSPDGIINVATVTLGDDGGATMRLVVTDRRSVAKYGPRNELEVEVRGLDVSDATLAAGPDALLRQVLARTLGLWSEPVEYVTLTVAARYVDAIYLGDRVRFADWLLPNGRGGRGTAENAYRAGVVVGRRVALGPDPALELTLAVWGAYARAGGWAPACRVSAISGATLTVATGYVAGVPSDGPTDYAGSNLAGYAGQGPGLATVANDGGAGWFVSGDRVRLVRRDVTTATTSSGIVSTVTPATRTIVLQAAPGGSWPTWASTGIVDLVYDEYATAGLQAAQEDFAWIGDRATRVVDGTTDELTRWAP